jgi:hypothetical protein
VLWFLCLALTNLVMDPVLLDPSCLLPKQKFHSRVTSQINHQRWVGTGHWAVGTQILLFIPQIANPQILELIPQSQICQFLRCASPQITNTQSCKEKSISDPDLHWFAFNIIFNKVSVF